MTDEMRADEAEFGSGGVDRQVTTYFLACECKPGSPTFAVIDPFAYDIQPAYIRGTLGVLHYDPPAYALVSVSPEADRAYGYALTISHPDTIALLDRLKGFYGPDGFNATVRTMTTVTLEDGAEVPAWAYVVTERVVAAYESIEQVEDAIWDDDQKLVALRLAVGGNDEDDGQPLD